MVGIPNRMLPTGRALEIVSVCCLGCEFSIILLASWRALTL